jgi:hypothetical protein
MKKIYIYGLYNEKDQEIRYVGKTNKKELSKRLNEHICESLRETKQTHKRNWINNLINKGEKINIKCLEIVNDKNWEEKEKCWISKFNNLTNTTQGGEGGRNIFYTISYDDCKNYINKNLNIKSKSEWYKKINLLPDFIPINPREVYLSRGWISWGDFLGTGRIQDNLKAIKYMSYDDAKLWIKNNLKINTIVQWKKYVKEKLIPESIPNRPDRYYLKRGWLGWGDFLGTGRVANQNKKNIFLSYEDACKFVREQNIKSIKQFRNFKLLINIPTDPRHYYKEWISWGEFFGTGKKQDNLLSINYLSYVDAKNWIRENLSEIKSEKAWRIYVKNSKIPSTIPNHPELYYNRKDRGWLGWKDFLSKKLLPV